MRILLVCRLACVALAIGCLFSSRLPVTEVLESWKGILTYDDVLPYLGPPVEMADGERIYVAAWKSDVTHIVYLPGGTENTGLGGAPPRTMKVRRGWRIVLSFDRESHVITDWSYSQW
jgi:hypothetical protein